VDAIAVLTSFRIMADDEMIAPGDSITAIADSVGYFRLGVCHVEEFIGADRGAGRRICGFRGWITRHDYGMVSVEPYLISGWSRSRRPGLPSK
jgi:hypothetical protein